MRQKTIYSLSSITLPFIKLYWHVFKPKSFGVKCVICARGKILMIQHNYGRRYWTFPGGGIKKGETSENAVKREVYEETGIMPENLKEIGSFFSDKEGKRDTIYCFSGEAYSQDLKIDSNEILNAGWFYLNELPEISDYAKKILNFYK